MWVTRAVLTSEDAEDFGHERVGRARLGDEPVTADARRALQLPRFIVSGQGHNGNMSSARIILESAGRFPSIENGKAQIHQYDIGMMGSGVSECIGAVAGLYHVEA